MIPFATKVIGPAGGRAFQACTTCSTVFMPRAGRGMSQLTGCTRQLTVTVLVSSEQSRWEERGASIFKPKVLYRSSNTRRDTLRAKYTSRTELYAPVWEWRLPAIATHQNRDCSAWTSLPLDDVLFEPPDIVVPCALVEDAEWVV